MAALQTVGACLVIAMVVTPGATAYLLTDRFGRLIVISVALGATTSFAGAYISYLPRWRDRRRDRHVADAVVPAAFYLRAQARHARRAPPAARTALEAAA